ncbi:phosphoribosylanthranilate isomerase [Echinicola strongylocentroti]|uniref:N-(5'-phosphoribosyl)anthranilate isomerase n=1 Tax=Echinicola strongylocentroti TaxID=1795355 RepID=A0A2Z4IN02_9BACT|nr:phosphoribosylanthranilate isomerase [Echinicola strongylocentroti]AWW31976.1 phosphoribosylanthranilate isomerase [Echinicola strongylocentroti]
MLVKVCGMRDAENIRSLDEKVQPDLMGMIFYPKSSRYVADAATIPSTKAAKVGVFVNTPIAEIVAKVNAFGLAYIQLHGDEDAVFVEELKKQAAAEIIKVFRVTEEVDWTYLKGFEPHVAYFLFDTETKGYGGSGKKFNWELLEKYPLQKPFLLSGGIQEESVAEIQHLQQIQPKLAGVDINSKFELHAAFKDVDKVIRFVKALQENR